VNAHVVTKHGIIDPLDRRYPAYPRGEDHCIPEPDCYDILHIWPEHGHSYLWDMTGVSINVTCIKDTPEARALDGELHAWQSIYENRPLQLNAEWALHDPVWDSTEQQREFDQIGELLARKLFELFGGSRTVVFHPLLTDEVVFCPDSSKAPNIPS
jgi:hypothetical protein